MNRRCTCNLISFE